MEGRKVDAAAANWSAAKAAPFLLGSAIARRVIDQIFHCERARPTRRPTSDLR
jgi:hypothetical protein